jgi:hypothetical protein
MVQHGDGDIVDRPQPAKTVAPTFTESSSHFVEAADSESAHAAPSNRCANSVEPAPFGPPARLGLGVVAGLMISLPFAWILSYAAALPFFIGVFFFALLGLFIGAVTFRVAAAHRPYPKWQVLLGTIAVICVAWGGTIFKESRDFPTDMAKVAAKQTRDIGDRTVDQFHREVVVGVQDFLRKQYAPGGLIGYVRWIVTSGRIPRGEISVVQGTLSRPQHGASWVIRVVLSLGLISFGIASQTWLLTLPKKR